MITASRYHDEIGSTIDIIYGCTLTSKRGMLMESISYLPITIGTTKTFQENDKIYVSSSLLHYWGIHPSEEIVLIIGTKEIKVFCEKKEIDKDYLLVSEPFLLNLPLPLKEHPFLSHFDRKKKKLYLGPILAVVTELEEDDDGKPYFRSIHSFCEELQQASQIGGGFFYVFQLKDFSKEGIQGWYFEKDGWKKGNFPFPNVIYNRIHSRKMEASPLFEQFKYQTALARIPFFNEQFLSKWEVHKVLHNESHLHPYLPKTELLDREEFPSFLSQSNCVFIKPINGSQGRNIMKVTSLPDHKMIVENSTSGRNKEFQIDSFFQWLQARYPLSTFIIQEAIPLLTYDNRSLDFRILCHKDYQNQWNVTSAVARVSAAEQFVSNLARGGELLKPLQVLREAFDQQNSQVLLQLMKEISLEAAQTISQSQPGLVGELGIDIGIDQKGKPWIIEVNSKPSKNFEEQQGTIRPSAKAIFEYGTSLAFHHLKKL